MNKKTYIQPVLQVETCLPVTMVCTSGVTSQEKDIEYGGVDEEGTLTPGARRHYDVWEDDEEDDCDY